MCTDEQSDCPKAAYCNVQEYSPCRLTNKVIVLKLFTVRAGVLPMWTDEQRDCPVAVYCNVQEYSPCGLTNKVIVL